MARFEADASAVAEQAAKQRQFRDSAAEALELRAQLAASGDVEAFRSGLQTWATKPGTLAFNGSSGQMLVNQLVKRSEDPAALARVLSHGLAVPRDVADAESKLDAVVEYVESIRVGAHPAPGRVAFLLSYFWALDDREAWPVIWPSAVTFAEFLAGESLPSAPSDRYGRFVDLLGELDADSPRFERVAMWWSETKPVFLDPVLVDRCAYGVALSATDSGAAQPLPLEQAALYAPAAPATGLADSDPSREPHEMNGAALVAVAQYLGTALSEALSSTIGRTLTMRKPAKTLENHRPRTDLWVDWSLKDMGGIGLRLWVNQNGVSIGIRPGWVRNGWYDEARTLFERADLPGFRLLGARWSKVGEDVGHLGGPAGEYTYARWFDRDELADVDVRTVAIGVAAAVQPLMDELVVLATGEEPPAADDPLLPLVNEFLRRGYPSPADEAHRADRERFADLLAADVIAMADPDELRRVWSTGRYGNPGPQATLNTTVRDADAAEYDRIIDAITQLCWGEGEDADRIDQLLNAAETRVRGLGESVVLKLLAICKPDRYLPVFPYSGPKGKRRMLQLLGLPEPVGTSRGALQVQANDALRSRLDRLFPSDPWGMTQFLYWYAERESQPDGNADVDVIGDLADELLVDRSFIEDIVDLLADKGQVILYGPPGTGKTRLARKLTEAVETDTSRGWQGE